VRILDPAGAQTLNASLSRGCATAALLGVVKVVTNEIWFYGD
jgi:hypothetical protein